MSQELTQNVQQKLDLNKIIHTISSLELHLKSQLENKLNITEAPQDVYPCDFSDDQHQNKISTECLVIHGALLRCKSLLDELNNRPNEFTLCSESDMDYSMELPANSSTRDKLRKRMEISWILGNRQLEDEYNDIINQLHMKDEVNRIKTNLCLKQGSKMLEKVLCQYCL